MVPTATMAEHLRNQLARASAAVRPGQVMTLAAFLESRAGVARPAPVALADRLIRQALLRLRPERFEAVARYPGFHRALAELMEEAPREVLSRELRAIADEVERGLAARGCASR